MSPTVTAATGVCHELGWNKSSIDVEGRLRTAQCAVRNRPSISIQDLFHPNS